MKTFQYTIMDENGVHARPAGLLVKMAAKYKSSITLQNGEKSGDAKKIFSVMGMGIKKGNEVQVIIDGEDEDTALKELKTFFEENL